jgi:uncharacterized membrane protein
VSVQSDLGPQPRPVNGLASRAWLIVMTLLSLGVGLYGLSYLSGHPGPPNIKQNHAGMGWVVVHATGAGLAVLLGPWQFIAAIRAKKPALHRLIGRSYLTVCLVGGISGLILAFGTVMGPVAQTGFGALALAWLSVNAMGYAAALRRDFISHRRWMIRSFALTLAAVTLRIYLPATLIAGFPVMIAYPIIAWACWVPNLVIAEAWLRLRPASPILGRV